MQRGSVVRTSVFGRWILPDLPDLWLTGGHFTAKLSSMGQCSLWPFSTTMVSAELFPYSKAGTLWAPVERDGGV